MGKMPVIWHPRFGIQGPKSVKTASRSNTAVVAQCANTHLFQSHTKRRASPPTILFVPLLYGTSLALCNGGSIETEWLLFQSEECHDK
jgi:hypothetical protein